jgi:hypothetical protein
MGTSEIVLERVQALLKIDTGSGSLHEHLIRLSRKLADEKPGEALAQLETLSSHLKQASFRGRPAPDEILPIVADPEAEDALLRWCSNVLKLCAAPSDPTAAPKVLGMVQNFMEDAAMFRWAGIGFGQQESYHIALSLRKLASDIPSVESLRLWGKVLGTEGDYYVAEGLLQSIPKPPPDDNAETPIPVMPDDPEYDVEPRGEGANSFTYWISLGATSPWERLPAARASQIVASRAIKKVLTGNMDAPVLSMPWFLGKERHLLRSQIARISATCSLAPKGYYEEDAEAGIPNAVKEAEDPLGAFPGAAELETADGWVHRMPHLMKIGKCSFPDISAAEDKLSELKGAAAAEASKALLTFQQEQAEQGGDIKPPPPTQGIGEDLMELYTAAPPDSTPAWTFKSFGDQGAYPEDKSHKVIAVRSTIWPGAVTVAQGTKFANIYVGYAMKTGSLVPPMEGSGLPLNNTSPFLPLVPDPIMTEPDDLEEQAEPNPKEEDDMDDDDKSVDEDPS